MSALDTWFNKCKRSLSCFLTSDAEVKKINVFYYAHVSTDIKLTESFDTEILQIPPAPWPCFMDGVLVDLYFETRFFHWRPQNNLILPLVWTLLSANGHWVCSRPKFCFQRIRHFSFKSLPFFLAGGGVRLELPNKEIFLHGSYLYGKSGQGKIFLY